MERHWVCRDYQAGDEDEILTLYKEVNNREMTLAHWKWKFTNNPFGNSIIKLLFDGAKLIGHYAIIPMDLLVKGALVKAALSVNTMTHPDYGRRGIFSYLAGETYKHCQQVGIKLVYGFPNQNSYYGFIKRLTWQGFGLISVLEKEMSAQGKRGIVNEDELSSVNRFDERVTSLWHQVKKRDYIIVTRTERYLNWRFAQHPVIDYEKVIYEDGNSRITGYLVLKTYHGQDETIGHIVDVLSVNDEVMVRDFVNYALNYFAARNISKLSCWVPEDSLYAMVLSAEGFKKEEFNAYFGFRILGDECAMGKSAGSLSSWYLTMGDADIF